MWLRLWWVRSVMTVDPWTLHYQLTLPELWCHGNRSVQTAPYLSVLFCLRDTLLLMFKLDISFRGRKFVSHPTGFISCHMINDLKVVILIQARRSITSKPCGFLSSESWQLNGSMAAAERDHDEVFVRWKHVCSPQTAHSPVNLEPSVIILCRV